MEKIRKLLHDKLGWGYRGNDPKIIKDEDFGLYMRFKCRFCDRNLGNDSQGNYFHLLN